MRPEMRPEQNWTGWQDNRGCYVAMHSTHGMTPGQDLQQLYSPANGFYMGNYGHPISHSYGHHAPVTHMPGAYTIAQEQHAVRSTPSSPQKTPKVESPGPEMLNNVHYEAMDKTAVSGIWEFGISHHPLTLNSSLPPLITQGSLPLAKFCV